MALSVALLFLNICNAAVQTGLFAANGNPVHAGCAVVSALVSLLLMHSVHS